MSEFEENTLATLVYGGRPITYGIVQPGPNISPDGIPLIRGKDYSSGKVTTEGLYHVHPAIDRPYSRSKVLGGDLLFSIVGYVGLTAEVPDELEGANITQTTARLSIDPTKADSTYVFHFLSSPHYRPEITRYEKGSAQPGLNLSDVQKLKIRHPKLPQQRRIATILTTLDEAIEATEKLVEKHQQIKAGLMHDLFTRGLWTQAELDRGDHKGLPSEALARAGSLRPTPEEALGLYQETEIGLFPKAWKIDLLDAFAKRGSGHTPNRHNPAYWNGGVKWVSLADSFRLDQLYISETDKEISQLGIENSSAVLHPPGIVVLSRDAGVGKSAITTCPMAVSQHFMCWLCGPELDNHYLYYWLQDQKRVFENISTGTTIPTIGLGFFRRYKIAIPSSPEEQQQIRSSLLSCDESLFALQDDLAKLRQQKQGLMHDLLTGRVRVEC
jgi:type I restriction enzyme S subunit